MKAVGRERNFATWIQQRIFELENTASNYRRIGQCVYPSRMPQRTTLLLLALAVICYSASVIK